MKFLKDL